MKKIFILSITILSCLSIYGQQSENIQNYRRSSLYSLLINHDEAKYSEEIKNVFFSIPIPEKFDNHDLSVRVVTSDLKKEDEDNITAFLANNYIAHRLIAKWFNRDIETGECDVELIKQRGYYDADFFDVELAKHSLRGNALLADAGEELIGNTFVLVNDIRYVDKENASKAASIIIKSLGAIASGFLGGSLGSDIADMADDLGNITAEIKGFRVNITSYLYRLDWNEEIAKDFYDNYYISQGEENDFKKQNFITSDSFKLTYVGKTSVQSGKTSMEGVGYDPISMIRKVCARAIDESIVKLQRTYDEFKVKTPIYSVKPYLTAKIGMKEGVSASSKYEVLEQEFSENGTIEYNRVGEIVPVPNKIWDNRYMAMEENAIGADLNETTFRIISGKNLHPGMLIREIK